MPLMTRPRFLPDNFTLTLVGVVLLASLLPASGQVAVGFGWLTTAPLRCCFSSTGQSCPGNRSLPVPVTGACTCWCSA